MTSKYDPFWRRHLPEILSLLKKIGVGGVVEPLDLSDIREYGNRNSWNGRITIADGQMVNRGSGAHMRSMGKILGPYTSDFPGKSFLIKMNNENDLMISQQAEPSKKTTSYHELQLVTPTRNSREEAAINSSDVVDLDVQRQLKLPSVLPHGRIKPEQASLPHEKSYPNGV